VSVFESIFIRVALLLLSALLVSPVSFAETISNSKASDDILALSAIEAEQVDAVQQMAELWGNWKIVEDKQFDDAIAAAAPGIQDAQRRPASQQQPASLVGDIWSFNQDASFISRQQGQRRGEAHYTLKLPRLEISQSQLRRQFRVLSLDKDQLHLQEFRNSNDADAQTIRELRFERSEEAAGQGPASIYYTPRQIATLQILMACGRLDAVRLELLYPPRSTGDEEKLQDANALPASTPKSVPVDDELLQQRQAVDAYLFRHVGVSQFDWGVYQASKRYYEADPAYNAVFPGIIHRGIRSCLN